MDSATTLGIIVVRRYECERKEGAESLKVTPPVIDAERTVSQMEGT
jgi:hypothetical protein